MEEDIEKLKKFREKTSNKLESKVKLVVNPDQKYTGRDMEDSAIVTDIDTWQLPNEDLKSFVQELAKNEEISIEEKILLMHQKICNMYQYDDNAISYFTSIDSIERIFDFPNEYGRVVDENWKQNREKHNRRVCFELSRIYAGALTELFKDNPDYKVCIFWNEELCHYFVGLTCKEYSLTLDVDDFDAKIKDLTRGKLGLKFKGIKIIEDKEGVFKDAIKKFYKDKPGSPTSKMREEIEEYGKEHDRVMRSAEDPMFVEYIKCVVNILNEQYRLDSQGIFEFTKEIVDVTLGPKSRTKIFKKIGDGSSKRYIRCLVIEVGSQKYLIDVDVRVVRRFDVAELDDNSSPYIATNQLNRNWKTDPYDGR